MDACVVVLEPWGNQEFDVSDLYYGAEKGVWMYLVHCKRAELPFDMEDLLYKYRELYPDEYNDSEYCRTFEIMLEDAGIQYNKLPDKCFTVYSTLF